MEIWLCGGGRVGVEISEDGPVLLLDVVLAPAVDDHQYGRLVLPDAVLDEALVHAPVGLGRVGHVEGSVGHDFDAAAGVVVLVLAAEGEAVVEPSHLRDRSAGRLEDGRGFKIMI